ncbi:hypothetical protein [Lactiplantibacillus mudanjiangensis]|uniref:hypothetical protein n=1 Tax=Lactiplantibacillus mudanjiangensis TaxID=1296538 RepID=UPI001030626F
MKTESQVRRVKRQNERQDNIFNYDFSAERTPVQPLIQLFPDSPKTDSKNFSEPMALYGNNSIHYTYWLSPEKLPDHLEINSSNFINHFHKKVSFKIPTIPNEIDKSTNVQD